MLLAIATSQGGGVLSPAWMEMQLDNKVQFTADVANNKIVLGSS